MAESSVLKAANIDAAIAAVTTYVNACEPIFSKLEATISNLTAQGAGFNGDSSAGYNDFFQQIKPALTTNLTAPDESLTASIKKMLEGIKDALLDQVDPGLGQANRNAGSAQ